MDLSQRTQFCHSLLHVFENLTSVQEPLINNWFDTAISQMHIFIFLVSTWVLFGGVFSLRVSLKAIIIFPKRSISYLWLVSEYAHVSISTH